MSSPSRRRHLAGICLILLLGLPEGRAGAQVTVVSSIRPLQLIAEAIAVEADSVHAVDGAGTAHNRSLAPRDRLRLHQADLVVWIDPGFEAWLADLLKDSPPHRSLIQITDLPGLALQRLAGGQIDPHLWLAPDNAIAIAERLKTELSGLAPDNAEAYTHRFRQFESALQAEWADLVATLQPLRDAEYAVYHDAYRYFEKAAGIDHALTLLPTPELPPALRDVPQIRRRVAALDLQCIIVEPDSSRQLVDTLTRQPGLRRITVDLLGYGIPVSDHAYMELLRRVAAGFQSCLLPAPSPYPAPAG